MRRLPCGPTVARSRFRSACGVSAVGSRRRAERPEEADILETVRRLRGNVELHFTSWRHDGHHHAIGLSYRLSGTRGVSAVLGLAYIDPLSENLLENADAYIELRAALWERYSCQVSHYSTVGDDRGDNLFLCGVRFPFAPLFESAY